MDTNLEIIGVGTRLPQEKRCYIPGVTLKSKCPKCGMAHERALGDAYLSYGSTDVSWYCEEYDAEKGEDVGCMHEWSTPMRVEIRFFPALPAEGV